MTLAHLESERRNAADERRQWLEGRLGALADESPAERWATREEAVSSEAIAAGLGYLRSTGVVEARAGIRILTGWIAGPPVALIGAIAARDGVGVDLAASRGVRIGLAAEGYAAALQIGRPRISVVAGHPWAGAANVGVVADERALDELVLAGIVAWCAPIVEALEPSGRGRRPVWAQVGDSLAPIAGLLAEAEPKSDSQQWVTRVERLLAVRPVPWRHVPQLWTADAGGVPIPVYQRASCCLYYRSEEPDRESDVDPDYVARFGQDSPAYCGTCRLRSVEDVEARAVYWALRARVPQESSVQ